MYLDYFVSHFLELLVPFLPDQDGSVELSLDLVGSFWLSVATSTRNVDTEISKAKIIFSL